MTTTTYTTLPSGNSPLVSTSGGLAPTTVRVRIRVDLQRLAKGAAGHAGMTLEAWLNQAVEEKLQRLIMEGVKR